MAARKLRGSPKNKNQSDIQTVDYAIIAKTLKSEISKKYNQLHKSRYWQNYGYHRIYFSLFNADTKYSFYIEFGDLIVGLENYSPELWGVKEDLPNYDELLTFAEDICSEYDISNSVEISLDQIEGKIEDLDIISEEKDDDGPVIGVVEENIVKESFEDFYPDLVQDKNLLYSCKFIPDRGYNIVINEGLLSEIEKLHNNDKKRLHKALNHMQYGSWELGVLVKKLKGVNEPVFEARLDRGRRILFQVKKMFSVSTKQVLPTLVIQDIVKHKHINKGAKRIASQDLERLNLQAFTAHLIGEDEWKTELHSPVDIEKIDPNFNILKSLLNSEIDPQETLDIDLIGLPSGIRYYRFDDIDREGWIRKGDTRLELALAPEQQKLRYMGGPQLINGSAGTGKTTILAYKFHDAWVSKKRVNALYITYSNSLRTFVRGLVQAMLYDKDQQKKVLNAVTTLEDLELSLIGSKAEEFKLENKIKINDFLYWLKKEKIGTNFDPIKIWEEIRAIIKGSCINYNLGIIPLKEYLSVGRDRSLFKTAISRKQVYEIARRYHKRIRNRDEWDELDLTQKAINELVQLRNKPKEFKARINIMSIICDEVQDLTETQYQFFYYLIQSKHRTNLYFAGDTQQIINPSRFRWADLKRSIWENLDYKNERKTVRDVISLTRNYRCSLTMIELANQFLQYKWKLLKKSAGEELQKGVPDLDIRHLPAYYMDSQESEIYELLSEINISRRRMIIVSSNIFQEELKAKFNTEFIFNVDEAKGLEFDATFLFNVASELNLDWRKILDTKLQKQYIKNNYNIVKHAFNILYVAITRARRHVAIYEKNPLAEKFWKSLKGDFLHLAGVNILRRIWNQPNSKEEWLEDAEYFFSLDRFMAASECFRGAGEMVRAKECHGLYYRELKEYNRSAPIFESLGKIDEAASDYEKYNPSYALKLFERLNDKNGENRCKAILAEHNNKIKEAAQHWEYATEYHKAILTYKKLNLKNDVFRCQALLHEKYKEWEYAAKSWTKIGNHKRSKENMVRYHEMLNDFEEAAKLLEVLAEWERARDHWKKLDNNIRINYCNAKIELNFGNFTEGAQIFEDNMFYLESIDAWKRAGNEKASIRVIAKLAESEKKYRKAYNCWYEIEKYEDAKRTLVLTEHNKKELIIITSLILEQKEEYEDAADYISLIGDYNKASMLYESANHPELALEMQIQLAILNQEFEVALKLTSKSNYKHLEQKLQAIIYENDDKLEDSVNLWKEVENWPEAISIYEKLDDHENINRMKINYLSRSAEYSKNPKIIFIQIGDFYVNLDEIDNAAKSYELGEKWDLAAKYFEQIEKWESALQNWSKTKNKRRVGYCDAKILYNKGLWKEAGFAFEKLKYFEEAIQIWRSHDSKTDETRCLALLAIENGEYMDAHLLWKEINNYQQSRICLVRSDSSNKDLLKFDGWVCEQENNMYDAAEYALLYGDNEHAIQIYKKLKDERLLNEALLSHFISQNKLKEAIKISRKLNNKKIASKLQALIYENETRWLKAANLWMETEDWLLASFAFIEADKKETAKQMYIKHLGKKLANVVDLEKIAIYIEIAEHNKEIENFEQAAEYFELASNWDSAAELWVTLDQIEKALDCYGKNKDWFKIAKIYESLDNLEEAHRYYEKSTSKEYLSFLIRYPHFNVKKLVQLKKWDVLSEIIKELEPDELSIIALASFESKNMDLALASYKLLDDKQKIYEIRLTRAEIDNIPKKIRYYLRKLGRDDEMFNIAIQHAKKDENWYFLFNLYKDHNNIEEAKKVLLNHSKNQKSNLTHLKRLYRHDFELFTEELINTQLTWTKTKQIINLLEKSKPKGYELLMKQLKDRFDK